MLGMRQCLQQLNGKKENEFIVANRDQQSHEIALVVLSNNPLEVRRLRLSKHRGTENVALRRNRLRPYCAPVQCLDSLARACHQCRPVLCIFRCQLRVIDRNPRGVVAK